MTPVQGERQPLRVLVVDDSAADARLCEYELRHGGFEPTVQRVESVPALQQALRERWDVILTDYNLPAMRCVDALRMAADIAPDVPVIVVSGSIGEEFAVEAMRYGAQDFVSKHKLWRLAPAVARELPYSVMRRERRLAQRNLVRAEERFRHLVESVQAIVWQADPETFRFTFVSPQAEPLLGFPVAQWLSEPDFWISHMHPEDREWAPQLCQEACAEGRTHDFEYRMIAADGRVVWLRDFIRVTGGPDDPKELVGVMVDITAARELEDRLMQSQKMEAIGQLAGGIAHDFNNLLTIIMGRAEQLRGAVGDAGAAADDVREIARAAERAASLTRQLLAFSRRQLLAPRVVDLNEVIGRAEDLLRRLIGENITLSAHTAPALWTVRADPNQIDQVLMNLAVNARDAMPGGGLLMLETANEVVGAVAPGDIRRPMAPGEYVRLTVRDTGHGMDAAVKAQVFDPFFTTKPPGQGTGLGLSTVYGIVKQSNGFIWIDSQPGEGAAFHTYLPRVTEAAEPLPALAPPAPPPVVGGTVLLVEDEEAVRSLVKEVLARRGYDVLCATDGEEALQVSATHGGPIALLITDLVMPRIGGRELAASLAGQRAGLKVLFMSGYTDESQVTLGIHESGHAFIGKPFSMGELVRRVGEILATS